MVASGTNLDGGAMNSGNTYVTPVQQPVKPIAPSDVLNGIISAKEIKDKYMKALRAVNWEYREYWLNYAFWRDRQWVRWDISTDRIIPINRIGSRYQATVNRIKPAINQIVSTVTQDPLVIEVPPQAADDYAMQGAQTAEAILRDKIIKEEWEEKKKELAATTIIGGTGAIAVEWDDTAAAINDDIKAGDTVETVLSIVDFVVEPAAKKANRARWWIKSQILNPDEVQARFDLPTPPPADALTGGPFHQRILPTADTRMNQQQGCMVLTYYERPNALRKTGAVAIVVNNQIVWGPEPWPFPFKDRLNIAVARHIVVPDKWSGDTLVASARSVQAQLNLVWTNIAENTKALGANKLLLPYGASDLENQWDDDPSHPIRYPEGVEKPSYLTPAIIPPSIMNQVAMLENEITQILNPPPAGAVPGQVESGFGVELLQEQGGAPTANLAKELGIAIGQAATMCLELYADRVKDERTASVYSRGNPIMSYSWTGKDIAGQTTAIVPLDTVMPRNKAAAANFAKTLLQMRPDWFKTYTQFADASGLPNDEISWRMDTDTRNAQFENSRMSEGNVVLPADYDDHAAHIAAHNEFRKMPQYKAMPKKLQEIIDAHVAAHEGMANEQAGIQVAKAAMHPALGTTPTASANAPIPGNLPQPAIQPPGQPPQGIPQGALPQPGPGALGGM